MTDNETENFAHEALLEQDYEKAIRLLMPLAAKNSPYAVSTLDWVHENANPEFLDKILARKYYERAISTEHYDGYMELGWHLLAEEKFDEARALFETGKEKGGDGFDDALKILFIKEAEISAYNAIKEGNYQKAFEILESQKQSGSVWVLTTLGWLLNTGVAGKTDILEAGSLYKRAAEMGDSDAYYRLGLFEMRGGNNEAARAAFLQGAMKKHMPSISKLGEMMIEGKGGTCDTEEGFKNLIIAANMGHIKSKAKILHLEIAKNRNLFLKIFLYLKFFILIKETIIELYKDSRSKKLYGLIGT